MNARPSYPLLALLAGVGVLLFLIRYRKGGEETVVDLVEEVVVTARRAGAAVVDALAALGDWTRKIPAALREVFAVAAAREGMPAGLLEAVAYRESRFRADIINGATRSSAGAVGVMQIVPKWHPELGEAGALDPKRAIPYAANYLRQLRDRFGTWRLALAAYNWGPGNLAAAAGRPESSWPSETRAYVEEITRNAGLA